ncbi:MAG: hypothetical protein KKI07_00710 [Euryarchaeota archaeon]|nr:hypothetical protein [Euryarchaeota archaeon]
MRVPKVEKYIKYRNKLKVGTMNTTIKIRENDKKEFDLLQSEFVLKVGKKVTQQELFSKLLDFVESSKGEFFTRYVSLPLSNRDVDKFRKLQSDWGVVTREKEVDEVLYGAQ